MSHTYQSPRLRSLCAILLLLIASCQKSDVASPNQGEPTRFAGQFRVSLNDAAEVAAFHLSVDSASDKNARVVDGDNEILERKAVLDSADKQPLLYIFKKRRGFAIVSGDLRVMPVLAHSEKSSVDLNDIPTGVRLWMETAKHKIREARKDTSPPHPIVLKEWQKYLSRQLRTTDTYCIEWYQYGQFQCKYTSSQKGPLLTTAWGQHRLSTTQLSTAGNCDGCGRRKAGCGPVAMAQLEEFYHPNLARPRFPKDTCFASNAGEISLGALMKNMGDKAKASYNYMGSCNTFTWPSNVKSGLKDFGFSNGGNGNEAYNYNLIKSELNGKYPLIFWGSTCLDCWDDYHVWLCDGYLEHHYSDFNCTTKQCNNWSYYFLHMNWGWAGGWDDYYALGQYNPGGEDYNGNLHVITGIRP